MNPYQILQVTLDELMPEAGPLLEAHYQELSRYKDIMVMKPDMNRYRALEANGCLLILAAYVEGVLVGYSAGIITNHLHYADLIIYQNDVLFLDMAHRKGRLGIDLIKRTEKIAKERDVKLAVWHGKQDTPLAALLPKMKYGIHETIYTRKLTDED